MWSSLFQRARRAHSYHRYSYHPDNAPILSCFILIFLFTYTSRPGMSRQRDTDREEGRQIRVSYTDLCQRWCVLCVNPCLGCTDLTVSSHSASSTSNLYWLTSGDFADTLQSTSSNLSPPLSGCLSPSSHLFFSHFRDNKCSRADSQRQHCCVGMMFDMKVEPLHAGARFHHRITTGSLYLCQTSQNNYYVHIFIHIRVSHSLLLHSYISTTQLFDTWQTKQPEGMSIIIQLQRGTRHRCDCEWVLQRGLK